MDGRTNFRRASTDVLMALTFVGIDDFRTVDWNKVINVMAFMCHISLGYLMAYRSGKVT